MHMKTQNLENVTFFLGKVLPNFGLDFKMFTKYVLVSHLPHKVYYEYVNEFTNHDKFEI